MMKNKIKTFLLGSYKQNVMSQNIGFLLLRFFVGLAFCTVFEKFFPKNGIWGPQEWFVQDIDNMGFPFPLFFAWLAVLSEFFGGILMMIGLFTRPASLLNAMVTFTATFIYHHGDIGNSGLLSFFFLIMCVCILLFGPGKFSLDYLINKNMSRSVISTSMIVLLLLCFNCRASQFQIPLIENQNITISAENPTICLYLKNNSLLPKKITLIIYQPQQEGNNTLVKWFMPFQKVKIYLPVTSKIYLATKPQIATVMQGNRIDQKKPFIFVDKELLNTTVPLKSLE